MNRAPLLRQRRLRILEQYPCLGSHNPQLVTECIHSEWGAPDAYAELCDIDAALTLITNRQTVGAR